MGCPSVDFESRFHSALQPNTDALCRSHKQGCTADRTVGAVAPWSSAELLRLDGRMMKPMTNWNSRDHKGRQAIAGGKGMAGSSALVATNALLPKRVPLAGIKCAGRSRRAAAQAAEAAA